MRDLVDLARDKRAAVIRELNDAFRRTFSGGKVVMTASVAALPEAETAAALQAVRNFDDTAFDKCNDPYGQHDFVAFELCDRTFFFKIDYYDTDLRFHSEDPADPQKTIRVGTLMLNTDY